MRKVVCRMSSAYFRSISFRSAQCCMNSCEEYTRVSVLSQSLKTALSISLPSSEHRAELRSIVNDPGSARGVELAEHCFHPQADFQALQFGVADLRPHPRALIQFDDANRVGGLRLKDFRRRPDLGEAQ